MWSLADIGTKQPDSGTPWAVVTLGGVSLYGPEALWLDSAVERIRKAVEQAARERLLVVRKQLEKVAKERIGEDVSERVLGAVIGRSLRLGITIVLPCLTINGHILRMYSHKDNVPEIRGKLALLDALLTEKTAISVEAGQSACFPGRGWETKFLARQLLSHLAYKGRAVFVDDDLFASPLPVIQDALRNRCK
jgi:hypothetical protein